MPQPLVTLGAQVGYEGDGMVATGIERRVAGLREACARTTDATQLFADASTRLRTLVPFDGSCWFATDPQTILATSPVRVENVEPGHCDSFWERECGVEDAILFRDLARTPEGIGTLYAATDERPARSARYREFLAPQGYGDELRAVMRVGESTWGVVDLFRETGRPAFSPAEVEVVRTVAPAIGAALRTLVTGPNQAVGIDAAGPGTALFEPDGTVLSFDATAEALFAEVAGPAWDLRPIPMTPVYAAVARAIAVADGRDRGPASARVRARSGRWLTVHASCLRDSRGRGGPIALTIEPSKSAQIAPIIVEAYGLTGREQEITRAVARGLSNQEIAAELYLSPYTVRDHLKAVFGKIGVTSRGELVAKLFAEHYGPALHGPTAVVDHVEV